MRRGSASSSRGQPRGCPNGRCSEPRGLQETRRLRTGAPRLRRETYAECVNLYSVPYKRRGRASARPPALALEASTKSSITLSDPPAESKNTTALSFEFPSGGGGEFHSQFIHKGREAPCIFCRVTYTVFGMISTKIYRHHRQYMYEFILPRRGLRYFGRYISCQRQFVWPYLKLCSPPPTRSRLVYCPSTSETSRAIRVRRRTILSSVSLADIGVQDGGGVSQVWA